MTARSFVLDEGGPKAWIFVLAAVLYLCLAAGAQGCASFSGANAGKFLRDALDSMDSGCELLKGEHKAHCEKVRDETNGLLNELDSDDPDGSDDASDSE